MKIIVKKPTDEEKNFMKKQSVWCCEPSTFDWFYDSEEHCILIEGDVTVTHEGGSASFSAGDYVIFPKGMSCVWEVREAVRKYYIFK